MRFVFAFLSAVLCAAPLSAGPWAREQGQIFTAIGGNFLLSDGAQLPVNYDPTFYGEYGLNGTVTIGVDYHTADLGRIQAAVFSTRKTGRTRCFFGTNRAGRTCRPAEPS